MVFPVLVETHWHSSFMQVRSMNINNARAACLAVMLFALLSTDGGMAMQARQRPLRSTSTSNPPPPPPVNLTRIGNINYTGPHTWDGVLTIHADHAAFGDGRITATVTGIPQGVTFQGNRTGITLRHLVFEGVGDGVNIGNNQRVDELVIDNCHFLNCRTPNVKADDVLLNSRGYGIFGARGRSWTITNSIFRTCVEPESTSSPPHRASLSIGSQYAARLGTVHGLNVHNTLFENRNGKATMWLMFVRGAAFDTTSFKGGPIRIGVRPNDLPDVSIGECRHIIFRNCRFEFESHDNWPASVLIWPGTEHVRFERCTFTTQGEWWIDIDSRDTAHITWDSACTWNGKPITGYRGVRTIMSQSQMEQRGIGPQKTSQNNAESLTQPN